MPSTVRAEPDNRALARVGRSGAATYCNGATIQQAVFGLIAYQNDGKGCTVIADKIERA